VDLAKSSVSSAVQTRASAPDEHRSRPTSLAAPSVFAGRQISSGPRLGASRSVIPRTSESRLGRLAAMLGPGTYECANVRGSASWGGFRDVRPPALEAEPKRLRGATSLLHNAKAFRGNACDTANHTSKPQCGSALLVEGREACPAVVITLVLDRTFAELPRYQLEPDLSRRLR
jgi:hypothetical protein